MARIDAFLQLGREQGCSDIHFTVGLPPMVRMDGELSPLKYRELTSEEVQQLLTEIMHQASLDELERSGSTDLTYSAPGVGRFRFNVYRQCYGLAASFRVIPEKVPRLAELGLPPVVSQFIHLSSGLVLVTGGPGTGKTSTLAAMVGEINDTRSANIITLEDPVEYLHSCNNSLVIQREIGPQLSSFQAGLRAALRQDPDVILLGELRDPETITAAIEASETGHLVLGSMHTRGAVQTIHRLVDAFPTEAQGQIRHTLADNLKAVVSQELVRAADGRGRRVVVEILVLTMAIAQMVREGKIHHIQSAISTGRRLGMQLMDDQLLQLVVSGDVDPNEAFLKAADKREFIFHVTQPELLELVAPGSSAAGGE